MQPTKVIRAFLASRYPAAFPLHVICTRCNQSGLLDLPLTQDDTLTCLNMMVGRFSEVELLVSEDGDRAWSATPRGIKKWTLDGCPTVGD